MVHTRQDKTLKFQDKDIFKVALRPSRSRKVIDAYTENERRSNHLGRNVEFDAAVSAAFKSKLHIVVASDQDAIVVLVFVIQTDRHIVFTTSAEADLFLHFLCQRRIADVG